MRHIQVQELQGRVRKVHVGGPRGFRIAYFVHELTATNAAEPTTVSFPFFLSNEPRSRFDWDDFDWQGLCQEVFGDLSAGNDEKFRKFLR